jgi:hypothetical protein
VELDLGAVPEPGVSNRERLAQALALLGEDLAADELLTEAPPEPAPVITLSARTKVV